MKLIKTTLAISAFIFSVGAVASTSDMKTYRFTSNFVNCVKQYKSQSEEYVQAGNSMSSLMNGRGVIGGGKLDSSYWTYMDCLSPSASGTVSSALTVGKTCPEIDINTNYGRLYVPAGVEGKRVGVLGHFWSCQSGSWKKEDGAISMPGGDDIAPPQEKSSCLEKTVSWNNCSFKLSGTKHGLTVEDNYGPYFGDLSSDYEGKYLAQCKDGDFILEDASCEPVACMEGEKVEWVGSGSSGDSALCSGEVDYDGVVQNTKAGITYYKTEWIAKLHTKIIEGEATFVCKNNKWVKSTDRPSTCKIKPINELDCASQKIGKDNLYYCQ